ncbi:hypothetical protein [Rossellomorea sp. NRS-1567]|uniref:hypothetical protein n=1 Tax=Rossellomorea sp. NRS-1567 TaxID=3233901 RepID=UPI003D2CD110
MKLKGLIIAGTKGRYGKQRITINVYFQGIKGEEYIAFANSKDDVVIERGRTQINAIKKARQKATRKQEYVINQRKSKNKRT